MDDADVQETGQICSLWCKVTSYYLQNKYFLSSGWNGPHDSKYHIASHLSEGRTLLLSAIFYSFSELTACLKLASSHPLPTGRWGKVETHQERCCLLRCWSRSDDDGDGEGGMLQWCPGGVRRYIQVEGVGQVRVASHSLHCAVCWLSGPHSRGRVTWYQPVSQVQVWLHEPAAGLMWAAHRNTGGVHRHCCCSPLTRIFSDTWGFWLNILN